MSTEKYSDRQNSVLNTWGKGQDLFFYSEHENLNKQIIKVCDQNNVVFKQNLVFKKIEELFYNNYEWFFFGDDDTFVNVKLLLNELDNLDKNKVHGEDIFGCWKDLHFPSGGAGFLIHNQIIHKFFNSKSYSEASAGDVTFGLNMRDNNVTIENNEKFHSHNYGFYSIPLEDVYKHITFHYVPFDEMEKMNLICQKNTII